MVKIVSMMLCIFYHKKKRNDVPIHATTEMNPENIILK